MQPLPTTNCQLQTDGQEEYLGLFPWSRFWAALGMLILFLCALIVVLRWSPEPSSDDADRALLRVKNLTELQKANEERLNSYGWVDQVHGILHLPIVRAMELEIIELNDPKRKPHAVYAIAPIDLIPVPAGMPLPEKK